jgi:asparagine synthase (glutamine-hydrolysing)
MCGIAGVFAYGVSAPAVDRKELLRVRDHMTARGPDGEGVWFSPDDRVGLAHRRLAIIDLSERGAQPMHSRDGRYVITFNGEIYNYRELRAELESDGIAFSSDSDTEVVLQLFAREGASMLARLRGMFAMSIWDNAKRSLFLARDPFGIKPLYVADDGRTIRFASQVKALLQANVDRTPEPAGHAGFFIWGSVPEPWTLYRGIRALPAGCWMSFSTNQGAQTLQYASVAALLRTAADNPASCSRNDAKDAIAAALRATVKAHHVADVPVGVFLSAGLDSSLIAHLAPEPRHEMLTVTLGFAEYRNTDEDEVPLAEEVARTLGAWHSTITVSSQDFAHDREKLFLAMDQPSIDAVNAWFVSRAASQMGLKVALSGVGGDELFATYPSFRDVPRIVNTARRLRWLASRGTGLRKLLAPIVSQFTSSKYASLLEYGGSCGGAYLLRRALYLPWELESVFTEKEMLAGVEALQTVSKVGGYCEGNSSSRLAVSSLEMGWYMKNQLLRDTDWASMAHSLEVRTPLVDWKLTADVAPFIARHPNLTKAECFAAAAPGLPANVLSKPKTGFVVPVRDWLAGDRKRMSGERGMRGWAHHVYGLASAVAN